jgi:hypothetical protein
LGNATTGFKGVKTPNSEADEAKAAKELAENGKPEDVLSDERPVRNDNISVGGQAHLKETR